MPICSLCTPHDDPPRRPLSAISNGDGKSGRLMTDNSVASLSVSRARKIARSAVKQGLQQKRLTVDSSTGFAFITPGKFIEGMEEF
jgi:hypothetical protein